MLVSGRSVRHILTRLAAVVARLGPLRRVMILGHARLHARHPLYRRHPFDVRMGTLTGGTLPRYLLSSGREEDADTTAYIGCAPDTLRRALSMIPDPARWQFIDLGCGKGRALVVASEFPFRCVRGIELSPDLVRRARANAAVVAARHRDRPAIVVEQGDASCPRLDAPSVLMLYHPFGDRLVQRLVRHLEGLVAAGQAVVVLYMNPVHGDRFDASAAFSRYHAATMPHSAEDRAHLPEDSEAVVTWKAGLPDLPSRPGCDRLAIVSSGWRARLREAAG